ncbi:hypothetical protein [Sphingobacterium endophyticum]|uniref:hypothetical protein n=1 Tax=Sphingobacterium endophyticum TaxID=2546448 RepID=UPI0012E26C4D|nr:hypothetical protein [Sphingobacterium endophyticum]
MREIISGIYPLTVLGTFNIQGHEWQIRTKGSKKYIIDNTEDKYISGLFQVKNYEDEFSSFDYAGSFYFLSIDEGYVYIQFVNEKILK